MEISIEIGVISVFGFADIIRQRTHKRERCVLKEIDTLFVGDSRALQHFFTDLLEGVVRTCLYQR